MHYELSTRIFPRNPQLTLQSLTVVIGVRIHEHNLWLLNRLSLLRQHYSSLPAVIVSDFGSSQPYAEELKILCHNHGFSLHRVEDFGTYSHAICRNSGALQANTSHLFFMDPDFIGDSHFFEKLLDTANSLDMADVMDTILPVPVYHMGEAATNQCLARSPGEALSDLLRRIGAMGLRAEKGNGIEFVAPYSNNFLCSKQFFMLSGGYNAHFRGHGSEDFEFLLRCCVISGQLPLPEDILRDCFGPLHEECLDSPKQWRGFRSLLEALTFPAESAGLKMFHLWHPVDDHGSWRRENDWKRKKFQKEATFVAGDRTQLIDCNWLQPERKILVLLCHAAQVGFFLPLRLTGCDLELFCPQKAKEQIARLRSGEYVSVAIFNPYMTSHGHLYPVYELAKELGYPVIVIERGGLPDSIYYADDMAYQDKSYEQAVFMDRPPQAFAFVQHYLLELCRGASTLERNGDYAQTLARYASLSRRSGVCLIPLQLEEDAATTLFDEGYQSYPAFLEEVVNFDYASADDRLFFIKPHPLSKKPVEISAPNVILCQSDDNIHALLEMADTVICYNSGVGLLALAHHCSLKTVGNAYYNKHEALGTQCASFRRALHEMLLYPAKRPNRDAVVRLYDWLLLEKYSFFTATSIITEGATRRIHNYDDIHVYQGHISGSSWQYALASKELSPAPHSYLSKKFGINQKSTERLHIDFRTAFQGYNWHAAEVDGRWGGPDRYSGVIVRDLEAGQWRLVWHLKDEIIPGIIDSIRVRVNGHAVDLVRLESGLPCRLSGAFSLATRQDFCVVALECPKVVSPYELCGSEDRRPLTVRVSHVELFRNTK